MDYEEKYDHACDDMIKQLKIFKSFKEEIVNRLNMRERELNEICKKIRRHLRYERD
jgi:ribosome-associated translation inhibitor RaiA